MIENHEFIRTEPPKSPLDPFLCQFLTSVQALPEGYHPASDRHSLIVTFGWPADFADAIFTSAQARGMVERVPVTRNMRRAIWRLSRRGRNWLEMADMMETAPFSSEPDQRPPVPSM